MSWSQQISCLYKLEAIRWIAEGFKNDETLDDPVGDDEAKAKRSFESPFASFGKWPDVNIKIIRSRPVYCLFGRGTYGAGDST